ncbi:MAG: flagellar protein FlaG [Candidatus Polarisedimenticolaceae bacterium]|nr:flagellar protein FlaG [Candidatus Polarisedimenticolaceae bacterium]
MINEISQNAVGALPSQSKGSSGSVSEVPALSAVKEPNQPTTEKQLQPEQTPSVQALVVDEKEIEAVVENLNEFVQTAQRQLEFFVDKESGKTIVRVIDSDTGDTIRNIPSEEILNMQKHLKEMSERIFDDEATGLSLLFKGKA